MRIHDVIAGAMFLSFILGLVSACHDHLLAKMTKQRRREIRAGLRRARKKCDLCDRLATRRTESGEARCAMRHRAHFRPLIFGLRKAARQFQMDETRQFQVVEIARIFRIPPHMITPRVRTI